MILISGCYNEMRAQKRTLANNDGHSKLNRETLSHCNSVNNLRAPEKQRHSDQLRVPGACTEYNNCIRRHVQSRYDSKENDKNARSKFNKKHALGPNRITKRRTLQIR